MTTAPALRMSVVSMARMQDSFYGAPSTPFRTKARMYKMVKKAVGLLYYGYDRSSDKKSVMYSPIMNLNDLDAVGTDFK
jgi:predicted Zn-dependent protease